LKTFDGAREAFHQTFHHLVHDPLDDALDQVCELIPQKRLEVLALPRHHLGEVLARHRLKHLPCERFISRTHRTAGMFGTS
jgi:hypothetical protein